jgi:hypothetical protein
MSAGAGKPVASSVVRREAGGQNLDARIRPRRMHCVEHHTVVRIEQHRRPVD